MASRMRAVIGLFFGIWQEVTAYDAIGDFMVVSNVWEHSQISLEVEAFNAALVGEDPDYDAAKAVYENGAGNSCKSSTQARTLQGFATKDLTGESFADAFYSSGLATDFWDTWTLAALNGDGVFDGLSRTKRVTSLKKGMMGIVTLYASHELEAGIVKGSDESTRSDSSSGHAWDEGWAFYYGVDGSNSPWEVAKKRDEDFPNGTQAHTAIVPYFNKGLISLRSGSYSHANAETARDTIYKMWAVTYLRATFKYLEISESSYSETAHAEGYAYYKAIDGWVASINAAAAETMRDALDITQTSVADGTYCAAKAAMEAAYPAMGIDCDMMGDWAGSVTTCATACSAATVILSAGADAVAAVSGSSSDMSCTPASTYSAIGAYTVVSNVLEHSQISLEVEAFNAALVGEDPDYDAAKAVYENGAGNSCKSSTQARTLQGFATKDLTGESFADAFYSSGLATDFWDTWTLAALNGDGVFDGLSRTKRVTSLKKGMMGIVTLYASHELEAGIVKGSDESTRSDSSSGHAWDEGWAFYYGVDGSNSPWEVAKKRDEDFPNGTQAHTAIVPYFNKGLISLRSGSYSHANAETARDTIYKMWAVTYLRATFKYLEISESSYSETAHAEGYAYYKAIDGWVASINAAAAETMRDALDITQTSVADGTYCAAKAAMEAAYPAMGIDCDMMGEWTGSVTTCTTACSAATVILSAGAGPVASGSESGSDVSCESHDDGSKLSSSSESLHFKVAVLILFIGLLQ